MVRHSIAVVGGGINGVGIAWELARKGYAVTLFERLALGGATSSASTKLIHGGLRYLENLEFRLVHESLRERAFLLERLPELVKPIEIVVPICQDSPRPPLVIGVGLTLYDWLAGKGNVAPHRRLGRDELESLPLVHKGLRGAFIFWDAQVDDRLLVEVVAACARRDGADIHDFTSAVAVAPADRRRHWLVQPESGEEREFDVVVAAAGPWMNELLDRNHLPTRYRLSLIRGSHLILRRRVSEVGFLLQSTIDRRVFFVLPWKGKTLVGTTEVRHREPLDHVFASPREIDYLVGRFNHYFRERISEEDVESTFAGVRPLIGSSHDPGAITREYRIETRGTLINVFGGKLTTFMALARQVGDAVDDAFGETRPAAEPVF